MYRYDEYGSNSIAERVRQFRGQTQRYLEGKLGEEEFRPLRLQNGLYVQRLALMLLCRVWRYYLVRATPLGHTV